MPLGQTANPLLQQTEQMVQARVAPAMQMNLQKAVTAGMMIMYAPQSHQIMMQQLTKPGDPAGNVAEGAAKLVGELYKQSRNTMPIPVMIPSATILMCEGLDFLSKVTGTPITPQLVAQAAQDLGHFMLILLGISQQKMHQVIAKGLAHRDRMAQQRPPAAAQPAPAASGIIGGAMQAQ